MDRQETGKIMMLLLGKLWQIRSLVTPEFTTMIGNWNECIMHTKSAVQVAMERRGTRSTFL